MARKPITIYTVEFKIAPIADSECRVFHFTSLAAIYDMFTPAIIGCSLQHLYNAGVSRGYAYFGRLCSVTQSVAVSKRQKCPQKRRNGSNFNKTHSD